MGRCWRDRSGWGGVPVAPPESLYTMGFTPFWCLNMTNSVRYPSPFSEPFRPWRTCEVEVRPPPPQRAYLSDTCAIPHGNQAKWVRYPPLCHTISKRHCATWGCISHWAAKVVNQETGVRRIEKGPCIWFPGPQEKGQKKAAICLGSLEYIFVEDKMTGAQRVVKGPCVWFPEPYDAPGEPMKATTLQDQAAISERERERA